MPKLCGAIAKTIRLHRSAPASVSIPAKANAGAANLDEPVSIRAVKRFMTEQEVTLQIPEVDGKRSQCQA